MPGGLDLASLGGLSPWQWALAGAGLVALLWLLGCRARVNGAQRAVQQAWGHWLAQQTHKLNILGGLSGPADTSGIDTLIGEDEPDPDRASAGPDSRDPGALWLRVQAVSAQYALCAQNLVDDAPRAGWRRQASAPSQQVLMLEHLFRAAMQGWLDSAPAPALGQDAPPGPAQDAADREASAVERLLQRSHPMLHTVLHLESDARQRYNAAAAHYNRQRRIGPTRALARPMNWPPAQALPEGLLRVDLPAGAPPPSPQPPFAATLAPHAAIPAAAATPS